MKAQDQEHGRTWRIDTEPATVGFRYKVFIEPFPEPVGFGWSEGESERAFHLLIAQMATMGATPIQEIPRRRAPTPWPTIEDSGTIAVSWCHECDKRVMVGRTCADCGLYLGMKLLKIVDQATRKCPECGAEVAGPFTDAETFWCPPCMGEVRFSAVEAESIEPESD